MHDDEPIIEDLSYDNGKANGDDHDEILSEGDEDNAGQIIKSLREKLKVSQAERQTYLEGWQRSKADYVNLKKTAEQERQDVGRYATEKVIHDFLNVSDSFDMAFANKTAWEEVPENWRKGVEYIYSQLQSALKGQGLQEIEALGKPFDPKYHHAVSTIPTPEEKEDQVVLEVMKKGYMLQDKIIRPAQVKVGEWTK